MFEKLKYELDAMKVRYHIFMLERPWMNLVVWNKWKNPFRRIACDIWFWHAKGVDAFIVKYQDLVENS